MDNCNCSPFGAPAASAAAAAAAGSGSQRPPDSPQCSDDPAVAPAADMSDVIALPQREQWQAVRLSHLHQQLRVAERDLANHETTKEKGRRGAQPKLYRRRKAKIELRIFDLKKLIAAVRRGEDVPQVQHEDPSSQSLDENVVRKPGSHVQTLQNLSRDNVCDGHRELMHGHAPPPPRRHRSVSGIR